MSASNIVTGMDLIEYTLGWLLLCLCCYLCGKMRGRAEVEKIMKEMGLQLKPKNKD